MNDIIYKPRSGEEVKKASGAPLHLYSDLCRDCEQYGVLQVLNNLFSQSLKHVILLQDPSNMRSGHWFSISMNPKKHEIYFFSTYGGKPDREKNDWVSDESLEKSDQDIDIFNDGLKQFQKQGWTIHYNDHKYQKEGDDTATCGIYTAAFLRSGLNPDEFHKLVERVKATHDEDPAVVFYRKYFL